MGVYKDLLLARQKVFDTRRAEQNNHCKAKAEFQEIEKEFFKKLKNIIKANVFVSFGNHAEFLYYVPVITSIQPCVDSYGMDFLHMYLCLVPKNLAAKDKEILVGDFYIEPSMFDVPISIIKSHYLVYKKMLKDIVDRSELIKPTSVDYCYVDHTDHKAIVDEQKLINKQIDEDIQIVIMRAEKEIEDMVPTVDSVWKKSMSFSSRYSADDELAKRVFHLMLIKDYDEFLKG